MDTASAWVCIVPASWSRPAASPEGSAFGGPRRDKQHFLNFKFSLPLPDLDGMHSTDVGMRFSEQLLKGPDTAVQKCGVLALKIRIRSMNPISFLYHMTLSEVWIL